MAQQSLKHGDFTGLAENYTRYRPGYSESVLTALLALLGKPANTVDAVDVGAGTGIWTAMIAKRGCRSVTAIEPKMLMVPAALAASLGFMLPIATAPNTIVFSSGHIKVKEMVMVGLFVDLIGIILILLFSNLF